MLLLGNTSNSVSEEPLVVGDVSDHALLDQPVYELLPRDPIVLYVINRISQLFHLPNCLSQYLRQGRVQFL